MGGGYLCTIGWSLLFAPVHKSDLYLIYVLKTVG